MSSVSNQEVSITLKLTPQLLTAKSYASAMDKLADNVKQWGPKELDFEVGSGAVNSTTEGVFKIRMGHENSTADTGLSNQLPARSLSVLVVMPKSTRPTALTTISKANSEAVSVAMGQSTSLSALGSNASQIRSHLIPSTIPTGRNVSQPLRTISVSVTSAAITSNTEARSGAGYVSNGLSTGLPSLTSNASQLLKAVSSINSNVSRSSPALYVPSSNNQKTGTGMTIKSNIMNFTHVLHTSLPETRSASNATTPLSTSAAPVTAVSGEPGPSGLSVPAGSADTDKKAAAAGAAAAAGILAGGGSITTAIITAGQAASAEVLAAGGSAAAADAAKSAAEEAVRQSEESEESEDEEEEEDKRLSSENQRGTTTAIGTPVISSPAITGPTTTPNTYTPATSAPATTTSATTTPVTLSPNRTMTSQIDSSSCAACATCPGFVFGAGWPDLGSTTSWADSDIDTEDDWDADIDDDEFSPEDADGEEGDVPDSQVPTRRALGGRFSRFARRGRHLHKRIVRAKTSTSLGKCTGFTKFSSKPAYYNAMNVAAFEATPLTMDDNDKLSMTALLRWAIPLSVPPGDCTTIPKWTYLSTTQCLGNAPLPDGSTYSKVPGVGEQVWQVGGAPNKINANRDVNIDHVYEAKYLDDFFEDLNVNQGFDCKSLMDMWESKDGSKLTNLFANLPSKTNREFVGMAKDLNSLKEAVTNKIWKKNLPLSWEVYGRMDKATGIKAPDITVGLAFTITGKDAEGNEVSFDPENDLKELTTAAQILDLINTPDAIKYMSGPNDRIYTALQAYGVPCQGGLSWADLYKSYILNRFATRNVELQDLFNRVLTKIGTGYRTDYVAAWKKEYPIERMQLPPPTSWAAEFPAIQQAVQSQFESDPASLGKRQAGTHSAAGACILNSNATAVGPSSTDVGTSATPVNAGRRPNIGHVGADVAQPLSLLTVASALAPPPPQTMPATTTPAPIVTPPSVPQTSTAAPAAPSKGDPCGPAIQDNPNYPNTCAAKPNLATTPQAYGVLCGSDGPAKVDWTACAKVASGVCENMVWTEYPKGAWVWNDPGTGCAIGTWMPVGTGIAMTPSAERCQDLILKVMTDDCSSTSSNVASVNVRALPSFSDVTQTGQQVNVGYPSYVVAGKSPKGLKQLPFNFGWSTASFQASTGMNDNNQMGLTESTVLASEPATA